MSPALCVFNDRLNDFEKIEANIFTPGQGICLQRLLVGKDPKFKFDHHLAYGSWYDVQIIAYRTNDQQQPLRYLRKGIYLKYRKTLKLTELTDNDNRDHGVPWRCSHCKQINFSSVAICEHCHTNKAQNVISALSCVPLVGIPFSLANAILRCGKATQSNKTSDKIDAGVTILFAVVDVVTAPFLIGALAKIPGKVAAQTGVKLTIKTVFCEAGPPLIKEFGKELTQGAISSEIKLAKDTILIIVNQIPS